jgi:hypothetical protein
VGAASRELNFAELFGRATLPEHVPALVEFSFDGVKPGSLDGVEPNTRVCRAQVMLFGDQIMNLLQDRPFALL